MITNSQFYNDFISKPKSLLVAPAGYGKTYTIAECLKYTNGTQLILTHTHAGVASIKEKIKINNIINNNYHIETIDSFAQKYVEAFYCGEDIPEQDNSNNYFPFIIQKAAKLVKINPIKDIIKLSYCGLFVDEYQDCNLSQHQFIMNLSGIIPTHILGDPLQGIFDFNGEELVNWDTDLNEFMASKFKLSEAWRWKTTNPLLGKSLFDIREKLEKSENIDLNLYRSSIEVLLINEQDINTPNTNYNRSIWDLLNEENLLIINPKTYLNARKDFIKKFNNRINLVEAIDEKDFYKFSKDFDNSTPNTLYNVIYKVICNIFNKTELNKWFDENRIKNKRDPENKNKILPIRKHLDKLSTDISFITISRILRQIKNLPHLKCYRKELFYSICKALEQAESQNISVYDSMKNIKNKKRRIGKEIKGKSIGTTLLTKGLQFNTVAILNAHQFKCPKNLYVALTRASTRLIVFTANNVLSPYNN